MHGFEHRYFYRAPKPKVAERIEKNGKNDSRKRFKIEGLPLTWRRKHLKSRPVEDRSEKIAYLAHPKFLENLKQELRGRNSQEVGNLVLEEGKFVPSAWAMDIWRHVEVVKFSSINEAIKILKSVGLRGFGFDTVFHRRAKLIQKGIRQKEISRYEFRSGQFPRMDFVWALLDANTLIFSKHFF